MRRLAITTALLLASGAPANADSNNILAGPIFGIRLGGDGGSRGVIGIEGGVGSGPERLNLGFEYRADKMFGYIEIDPWLLIGGSLGFGIDSDGNAHPVIGVWEGYPIKFPDCDADPKKYYAAVTVAGGYRYTGVHELYVSVKAGWSQNLCID